MSRPSGRAPDQLRMDADIRMDEEIRVLTSALEDLVIRIREFAERERRFTRDASHELRTPLTVIKMATDRLERDPDLNGKAAENLEPEQLPELKKLLDDHGMKVGCLISHFPFWETRLLC